MVLFEPGLHQAYEHTVIFVHFTAEIRYIITTYRLTRRQAASWLKQTKDTLTILRTGFCFFFFFYWALNK